MAKKRVFELSARYRNVMALIAEGCPDDEIARRLHTTRVAIRHVNLRIREKLGLRNKSQVAAYAMANGIATGELLPEDGFLVPQSETWRVFLEITKLNGSVQRIELAPKTAFGANRG